jgi:hypothetical protein
VYILSVSFICANRDIIKDNSKKYTLFADAIIFCVFWVLKEPRFPLGWTLGGLQCRYGPFGEENNPLPLPGCEANASCKVL